jgi:two-component system, cell cycle response regulator
MTTMTRWLGRRNVPGTTATLPSDPFAAAAEAPDVHADGGPEPASALHARTAEERTRRLLLPLQAMKRNQLPGSSSALLLGTPRTAAETGLAGEVDKGCIHTCGSAAEAEAALDAVSPSVLVVDLELEQECTALFRAMMDRPQLSVLPVLAIRGSEASTPDADWRRWGVDDLLSRDDGAVGAALLSHFRKRQVVARCIRRDALTELPNATAFCEHFEAAASLAAREQEMLCMAFVDVDGMKSVNTHLGRAAADDVLRRFAATLEGCFRRSDVVARWHGDTFAVLLPHTARRGALKAMQKALYVLRRSDFASPEQDISRISASIGVVQHPARASIMETLSAAARLLDAAKAEGRDRVAAEPDGQRQERKPRILLADDDEVTASVIRHRMERAGYEVVHVRDGASALKLAPEAPLALAILNIKTPELDGFEVLQRLRSIRGFRGLPVIMLSAMGRDPDLVRGFRLGADDYLIKPFSPAELVARVQRLLERA